MSVLRLTAAIVVSSIAIVPLYLVIAMFAGDLDNMFLSVALMAALIVSISGVLIVGLPVHFILVRLNKVNSVYYGSIGFIVPAITTLIVHPFGEDGMLQIAIQSLYLGLFGAAIALIFWKVMTYNSTTRTGA